MNMLSEDVKTLFFKDDGKIPNHPSLPVLLYVGQLKEPQDALHVFEQNGWTNGWTNGVFDYHHYHSNCHEVIGVMSGEAVLLLGGEEGASVTVSKGDAIVLPAGTGHKLVGSSTDFKVAGAYPNGMEYNLKKEDLDERPLVLDEIMLVPLPDTDPLFGIDGPLLELWNVKK
jgi:uncharacterized protein YjlB